MRWIETALKHILSGQDICLITIVQAAGSTPRETGAKMLVSRDGPLWGSIGGGNLEHDSLQQAQQALAQETSPRRWLQEIALGPALNQCCGGHVRLGFLKLQTQDLPWLQRYQQALQSPLAVRFSFDFQTPDQDIPWQEISQPNSETGPHSHFHPHGLFEEIVYDRRRPLWIFGAGHVGQALTRCLEPLPFAVTVVDPREDMLASLAPSLRLFSAQPETLVATLPSKSILLIMTHSHPLDYDLCRLGLARRDLAFLGLIGSATKKARFLQRLRQEGLTETDCARLTCPIGLPNLRQKHPEAIAISVSAQLLQIFMADEKTSN